MLLKPFFWRRLPCHIRVIYYAAGNYLFSPRNLPDNPPQTIWLKGFVHRNGSETTNQTDRAQPQVLIPGEPKCHSLS
jgi:hypothetical protein